MTAATTCLLDLIAALYFWHAGMRTSAFVMMTLAINALWHECEKAHDEKY